MRRPATAIGLAGLLLVSLSGGPAGAADAKSAAVSPAIPFESERAAVRGDRYVLRLNDDAARIPGHRIMSLPIVDGRLGDRVNLDGGLQVYFPYGRIVSAETRFQKYLASGTHGGRPAIDPQYHRVTSFDQVLGPICASEGNLRGAGSKVEMRINRQRAISVVVTEPISDQRSGAVDNVAYRVVTAAEITHLKNEPKAEALYRKCNLTLAKQNRQ